MRSVSEDELDARLVRAKPGEGIGLEGGVRAALDGLLLTMVSVDRPLLTQPRRASRQRRLVVAAAVMITVAIVALTGVGVLGLGSGGSELPLAVSAAEAAQLNRLARAASSQVAGPTTGQWLFQRVEVSGATSHSFIYGPHQGSAVSYRYRFLSDSWIRSSSANPVKPVAAHVSQRPVNNPCCVTSNVPFFGSVGDSADGEVTITSAAERKLLSPEFFRDVGPGYMGSAFRELTGGPSTVPPAVFSRLPTAPQELLASLRRLFHSDTLPYVDRPGAEMTESTVLWLSLLSILERSTGPKLRAAAYRALKYVPHLTVYGTERDADGRSGVAIAFNAKAGINDVAIVDQRTGELLQDTQTATRPEQGWPAGTVLLRMVWLAHGVVNSTKERPRGVKPLAEYRR